MTETIRLLALIWSPRDLNFWGDHLAIHCRTRTRPPNGISIASVTEVTDPYSYQILENVHLLNAAARLSSPAGPAVLSETVVLKLTLVTSQPVRYRILPWLEQVIKSYVDGPGLRPTAITAVYLVSDEAGTVQTRRVGRCVTDGFPGELDNWSYLEHHADFLDDLYYHGGPSAAFASQAAALALQFAEFPGGAR